MNKRNTTFISRRRVFQLSATFFSLLLILSACKKEDSDIGDSLLEDELNVQKIDTFSIVTYSEEVDSLQSDETSVSLLGAYNDPVFGLVECGQVFELFPSSLNPALSSSTVTIDSVVLSFKFQDLLKYGNLSDMTFEVFEITEALERDDEDHYTFETPANTGTDLVLPGFETQTPDPYNLVVVGDDTLTAHLRIPLVTTLGDELVADAEAGSMSSDATFAGVFNGLYVKVSGTSLATGEGSILYLALEDPLSELTLYYHNPSTLAEGEFSFQINSKTARYNEIQHDRTGTAVEALLADPSLGQTEFYCQSGSIRAIIEFPHIMDFYKDADGNDDPKIINRAELILPVQDYSPDPFNPSRTMFIARIVSKYSSTFTVDYNFGSSLSSNNTVAYDENEKEFRFIVTREIQGILNGDIPNNGLRIYPPNFFASSIERTVFNGQDSPLKKRPRLEITYTDY